jgi:hypothetical protein
LSKHQDWMPRACPAEAHVRNDDQRRRWDQLLGVRTNRDVRPTAAHGTASLWLPGSPSAVGSCPCLARTGGGRVRRYGRAGGFARLLQHPLLGRLGRCFDHAAAVRAVADGGLLGLRAPDDHPPRRTDARRVERPGARVAAGRAVGRGRSDLPPAAQLPGLSSC